jgi:pimeloyl-ACP methyl ester carboxylesterase
MSAANTQTVLVFVPGSFGSVKMYNEFADSLTRHGIRFHIVDTPSVGRREGLPPQTMSDDAAAIVKVANKELALGNEVVLMTHSYGGIPGTQSLQELSRVSREAKGLKGGIDKIIYLTSVVPPVGVANLEIFGSDIPDWLTINDDYMTISPEHNAPITFSDLPPERALEMSRQMPDHSTPSFREKLTYPGYSDVQVHYVVCEEDKLILPEHQKGMIEFVKGFTGKDVVVHKLQSGHVPTTSQPDNVAKVVLDVFAHTS